MNCLPVFCICSWYKVVLTQRRSQFIVRTDLTEFGQILRRCTADFSPVVICHNVELTYKAANICRKCEPSATYSSSTRRQTPIDRRTDRAHQVIGPGLLWEQSIVDLMSFVVKSHLLSLRLSLSTGRVRSDIATLYRRLFISCHLSQCWINVQSTLSTG